QQVPVAAVDLQVGDVLVDQVLEPALVGVRRRRGRRELLQGGLQRGEEDLVEAGEVAVEVALRGARATGDVGDARPVVAVVAEAVRGRRYELLAGLLAAFVGPLLRAL